MVFSSTHFVFIFLPSVLLAYYMIPKRAMAVRNMLLLFFSLVFSEVRSLEPQQGRYNDSILDYVSEYRPDVVIIMYNYGYQEELLYDIMTTDF